MNNLIVILLLAPAFALIQALVLQYATKLIINFKPSFVYAYKVSLLAYLGGFLVGFCYGFLRGLLNAISNEPSDVGGNSIAILISLVVQAATYAVLIKHPDTGPIGFGKAILVTLVQMVILLLTVGAIFILLSGGYLFLLQFS